MSDEKEYSFVAYNGKSFSVNGKLFYPLATPLVFLITVDKTEIIKDEQDENLVAALDLRMHLEDEEIWMTEDYEIVIIMSNSMGQKLCKLQHKYKADLLAFNGIFLKDY